MKIFVFLNDYWGKWHPVIEVSRKKSNGESWLKKFLSCGKGKGYKKLLVSVSIAGVNEVPAQDEYDGALEGDTDLDEKIV